MVFGIKSVTVVLAGSFILKDLNVLANQFLFSFEKTAKLCAKTSKSEIRYRVLSSLLNRLSIKIDLVKNLRPLNLIILIKLTGLITLFLL